MSDREAMSELSSSVHKGAGYDEVFLLGRDPKEDSPGSPKREPSTLSLSGENEEEDEGDVEEDEYDEGEGDEVDGEDEEGEDDKNDEGTLSEGEGVTPHNFDTNLIIICKL